MKPQKILISILMLITVALGIASTFSNDVVLLGICMGVYIALMLLLWYVEWYEQRQRDLRWMRRPE